MSLALLCLGPLIFLSACFDYRERIELREDLSGSVRISYTVPVSKDGRSRLSFLPANKADIQGQYEEAVPGIPFQLRNIKISPAQSESIAEKEDKGLRVSYRLEFTNPKILEYTPLGNTEVLRSTGYLQIKRSFPALQNVKQAKGLILKRLAKYLRKRFTGHRISYGILVPEDFQLSTNKGRIKGTEHSYSLGLVETLDVSKNIEWSLSLKKD